jgi:TP53 regulating kinase-like protein
LHAVGVVHGDLTTSNMMLRPLTSPTSPTAPVAGGSNTEAEASTHQQPPSQPQPSQQPIHSLRGEIVLIDFGLAQQTTQEEDRAVDLYVLERAFGSTHPREEGMFGEVLEGYREAFPKGAKGTLRRLEDVRMRGRKKSMIG